MSLITSATVYYAMIAVAVTSDVAAVASVDVGGSGSGGGVAADAAGGAAALFLLLLLLLLHRHWGQKTIKDKKKRPKIKKKMLERKKEGKLEAQDG